MNPRPPPPILLPLPTDFPSRLGFILRNLVNVIAHGLHNHPLYAALGIPLSAIINRAGRRLETLLTRLAAGPLPTPKADPRTRPTGPRPKSPIPTTHGWLIRVLGQHAAGYASQFQAWLDDPEAAALRATPAGRRALAPLLRLLGLSPRRQRRPRPATPATAAPAKPPRPTLRRSDPIFQHHNINLPSKQNRPWWCPPEKYPSG